MTIQISNFHVSDKSKVAGSGKVALLPHRKDAVHSGVFGVRVDVSFDPAVNDYPAGNVRIDVDLSDSFKGNAQSTLIEQINSFGKHTPTSVITGRCKVALEEAGTAPLGCRFWMLIANNKAVLGERVNGPVTNTLGWATTAAMSAAAIALALTARG